MKAHQCATSYTNRTLTVSALSLLWINRKYVEYLFLSEFLVILIEANVGSLVEIRNTLLYVLNIYLGRKHGKGILTIMR